MIMRCGVEQKYFERACVCVCACVRACVRACVCVCASQCMHGHACDLAHYFIQAFVSPHTHPTLSIPHNPCHSICVTPPPLRSAHPQKKHLENNINTPKFRLPDNLFDKADILRRVQSCLLDKVPTKGARRKARQ